MRTADEWFSNYAADHQNPTNRSIHWVCVPSILWSAIAALWTIPPLSAAAVPGLWAYLAMAAALVFYWRLSTSVGLGMLALFALFATLTHLLFQALGAHALLSLAVVVFVVAWVGQFIGHKYEGRKPSFLTDLSYLLVGPAWLLSKLMHRVGVA